MKCQNLIINIFIKKFNPKTPVLRFKQININFNFFQKILFFFKKGVVFAKGRNNVNRRTVKSKGPNYSVKKSNIFKIISGIRSNFLTFYTLNFFQQKFKLLKLIKFVDGSFQILQAVHGDFIGKFAFYVSLGCNCIFAVNGSFILLSLLVKNSIFFAFQLRTNFIIAKSAGTYCQVLSTYNEQNEICIIVPSGQIIFINRNLSLYVCLGRSAHIFNANVVWGAAGSKKITGLKPHVRGVAKNPVDHPHGGRTKTNSPELTPWGKIAKHNK
jgi:large subunit ribosomal protein L2